MPEHSLARRAFAKPGALTERTLLKVAADLVDHQGGPGASPSRSLGDDVTQHERGCADLFEDVESRTAVIFEPTSSTPESRTASPCARDGVQ
jgi:hypothetical protein